MGCQGFGPELPHYTAVTSAICDGLAAAVRANAQTYPRCTIGISLPEWRATKLTLTGNPAYSRPLVDRLKAHVLREGVKAEFLPVLNSEDGASQRV